LFPSFKFGQPLASDKDHVDEIIRRMRGRRYTENILAAEMVEQAWDRPESSIPKYLTD